MKYEEQLVLLGVIESIVCNLSLCLSMVETKVIILCNKINTFMFCIVSFVYTL